MPSGVTEPKQQLIFHFANNSDRCEIYGYPFPAEWACKYSNSFCTRPGSLKDDASNMLKYTSHSNMINLKLRPDLLQQNKWLHFIRKILWNSNQIFVQVGEVVGMYRIYIKETANPDILKTSPVLGPFLGGGKMYLKVSLVTRVVDPN
jgi:hypothetical protein